MIQQNLIAMYHRQMVLHWCSMLLQEQAGLLGKQQHDVGNVPAARRSTAVHTGGMVCAKSLTLICQLADRLAQQ
jgi:hypothetical protein